MLFAVLAASLSLMADTTAAPAPAPPAAQAVAAKPAKPALICRKVTPIGSRMPTRVCQTQEQIDQDRADGKAMLQDMQKINPEQIH